MRWMVQIGSLTVVLLSCGSGVDDASSDQGTGGNGGQMGGGIGGTQPLQFDSNGAGGSAGGSVSTALAPVGLGTACVQVGSEPEFCATSATAGARVEAKYSAYPKGASDIEVRMLSSSPCDPREHGDAAFDIVEAPGTPPAPGSYTALGYFVGEVPGGNGCRFGSEGVANMQYVGEDRIEGSYTSSSTFAFGSQSASGRLNACRAADQDRCNAAGLPSVRMRFNLPACNASFCSF